MVSLGCFPLPEIMSVGEANRGLGITNAGLIQQSAGYNEVSRRISCFSPVAEGYPLLDEGESLAGKFNTIKKYIVCQEIIKCFNL